MRRGIIVDGEFFAFLSRSGFVQQKHVALTTAWFGRFSARTSLQTAANARRYTL